MDIFGRLDAAAKATSAVVRDVRADQLGRPTPCSEWNVQALMNHLIGSCRRFVARAEDRAPGALEPANPASCEETIEQLTTGVNAAAAAWRLPGALERTVQSPFGEVNGQFMANITLTEIVIHGWDLAKATGQQLPIDQALVEEMLAETKPNFPPQARQSGAFGPMVTPPANAPATDQLAAFLGRQP